MNPVRRLVPIVLAAGLLAAACSGGTQDVARVGDTIITLDDIAELYDADSVPVGEEFRSTLFQVMAVEALTPAHDELVGRVVDEDEVDTLFAEFQEQIAAQDLTVSEALGVTDASDEMLRFNAFVTVLRDDVILELISEPGTLDLIYGDGLGFTEVCVRHILTETEDDLEAAVARLEEGEDFAEVAAEVSLDVNTPGGDLGCSLANRYVPEFAAASAEAEIGELYYPIASQFGFHAIIVDDRTLLVTREQLAEDPAAYVTEDDTRTLFAEWFNGILQEADAEVLVEDYGTWTPVGIAPPEGE